MSKQLVLFVCHTNRPELGLDGKTPLEAYMHNENCAAMWEYPKWDNNKVCYVARMREVEKGNLIFMYANGEEIIGFGNVKGIIGVGKATACCDGPIPPGDKRRLRGPKWKAAEWQVPVYWLRWKPENPCPFPALNRTFYNVSGANWIKATKAILLHFNIPVSG